MSDVLIPVAKETIVEFERLEDVIADRRSRYSEKVKRLVDVVLGSIALVLSFPILVVCGIIIKLIDNGPCIYTQVRAGKDGKPFKMYKLRTMVKDAEEQTGPVWASGDDPRVLPFCKWMRMTHIDELPQLINVLKGEMSLVGPRPERPEILESLKAKYPYIDKRLTVLPGITGAAQIRNGYDKSVDTIKLKLQYDFEYIANQSLATDLKIILATIPKFYDKSAH